MTDLFFSLWIMFCALLVVLGCGSKQESTKSDPESKFATKAQPLIAVYCANCHDGVKQKAFDTEERWLTSKAKARIENNTMPPNKPLESDVKAKFIASF